MAQRVYVPYNSERKSVSSDGSCIMAVRTLARTCFIATFANLKMLTVSTAPRPRSPGILENDIHISSVCPAACDVWDRLGIVGSNSGMFSKPWSIACELQLQPSAPLV